ncbi:adhesin [Methanobrevibacter sp.]|uniref:adhesin n=1 Tax=Methanobrevibacter sp. TaxID=66852 RepID=UPI0026E0EAB0|nr:adhesin [Methanobrevibacter sp.]
MAILLINVVVADVSATTVFLTSDNIANPDADKALLDSISKYVEELSNGQIKVTVDNYAPQPGESSRAIEANDDVRVVLGACCAGSFYIMAKYAAVTTDQIIYINSGDFDLDTSNNLRRAWDDNYSNGTFAGINNPGQFLNESGVSYIQPLQKYPDAGPDGYINTNNDEVSKYIAEEIINAIENPKKGDSTNSALLVTHKIPVSKMAEGSSEMYSSGEIDADKTYNGYSAPQLLYLTSSYLNGNGIDNPSSYDNPSSPLKYSIFAKDSYSIYQYMEMGGIVKKYMDENNQAPDYINYQGAYLSYDDLQYNFAKITANHTDYRHMDFEGSYSFDKTNESILIDILPFLSIIILVLLVYLLVKRVKKIIKFKK